MLERKKGSYREGGRGKKRQQERRRERKRRGVKEQKCLLESVNAVCAASNDWELFGATSIRIVAETEPT